MKVPRLEPIVYLLEEDDGVVVFDSGENGVAAELEGAAR
jgi:hypothetical protein